jgi:hypothetical protein
MAKEDIMTFKEFQQTSSWGNKAICPRCLTSRTEPYPGCHCPSNMGGYGTNHIMLYHHRCPKPSKFYDATQDPDVLEALGIE